MDCCARIAELTTQLFLTLAKMPLNLEHVATNSAITDEEIVRAFASLLSAMRLRGIVRTRNVVGDLGERYAIRAYEQHCKGPLKLADTNKTDVDATDVSGRRFAVKAVSPGSTRTSAFHFGEDATEAVFDYLVVVRVDDLMQPVRVLEFAWEQFWRLKRWSVRQKAWFLPLTRAVLSEAEIIVT